MSGNWIGHQCDDEIENNVVDAKYGKNAVYFRKEFSINRDILSAVLKVSSLGIYKIYINGEEIGDDFLSPGWTDYNKRVHYFLYDITGKLKQKNAVAVALGDGWYTGNIGMIKRMNYGGYPLALFAELTLNYKDKTKEVIYSDASWKCGEGAIGKNDIINGEYFDNRNPHMLISVPDFDDSKWSCASILHDKEKYTKLLEKADYEPVKIFGEIQCKVICREGNKTIYDFQQNFAGFIQASFKGTGGSVVRIRHAEMLNEDNSLYLNNLRTSLNEDIFILNGNGIETYRPTFTYRGFRYAEINVIKGSAEVISIKGLALTNALRETGTFTTSNALLNRLYSNICWGRRSNFISIPTDCPQRDERLGWTADAQIFAPTGMYLSDCRKFYKKYMVDIDDATACGKVPDCAPFIRIFDKGSAGWADAAVIIPYYYYMAYGDNEIILKHLKLMKAHIAHCLETSDKYIRSYTPYADWLNIDDVTEKDVIGTAYFAYCTLLLSRMLKIIGQDGSEYENLYQHIKEAFNKEFVSADYTIKSDSQTSYLLAAAFGLVDKQNIKHHLVRTIARKDYHINTGFLGVKYMLPMLSDMGLSEIAYKLILNETYPSWGYSIKNGATTCWERWNSYTKEKGFLDDGMNSFNHYAFGSCGEWLFAYMLGIRAEEPGFKRVRIKPCIDTSGKVTFAKGSYESVSGKITCAWQTNGLTAEITVENPDGIELLFDIEDILSVKQDGLYTKELSSRAKKTEITVSLK